jgi:hypothetical protein
MIVTVDGARRSDPLQDFDFSKKVATPSNKQSCVEAKSSVPAGVQASYEIL